MQTTSVGDYHRQPDGLDENLKRYLEVWRQPKGCIGFYSRRSHVAQANILYRHESLRSHCYQVAMLVYELDLPSLQVGCFFETRMASGAADNDKYPLLNPEGQRCVVPLDDAHELVMRTIKEFNEGQPKEETRFTPKEWEAIKKLAKDKHNVHEIITDLVLIDPPQLDQKKIAEKREKDEAAREEARMEISNYRAVDFPDDDPALKAFFRKILNVDDDDADDMSVEDDSEDMTVDEMAQRVRQEYDAVWEVLPRGEYLSDGGDEKFVKLANILLSLIKEEDKEKARLLIADQELSKEEILEGLFPLVFYWLPFAA